MQITWQGEGKFEIKAREGRLQTGENFKVNDVVVSDPGEYEVGGVILEKIGALTRFVSEEMTLAYLDKRKEPLTDQELEFLGNVDVLFLPTGSPEVLSTKDALAVMSEVEARIVIPMHFDDLGEFCKAEGLCVEEQEVLKLSRSTLPQEGEKVVVLKKAK